MNLDGKKLCLNFYYPLTENVAFPSIMNIGNISISGTLLPMESQIILYDTHRPQSIFTHHCFEITVVFRCII